MERYTIERQKAALRTRQAARALRGLLDDIDSEYTIYTMEAIAEGLAFARQRDCHCGEPATEMVARPRNGATDVVSAVSGLLDGTLVEEWACSRHSRNAYVGYPLCACGQRAGFQGVLSPKANRKISRFDARLWDEFRDRTYLLCSDCVLEVDAESVAPWLDGRIAPEQASMLDTLLRRVGLLMEAGIEAEESFDRLDSTTECGFLRHAIGSLVLDIEELAPLASDPTAADRVMAALLLADPQAPGHVLDDIEYMEAARQSLDYHRAPGDLLEFPVAMEAAAD